jgi:hypothetical protein
VDIKSSIEKKIGRSSKELPKTGLFIDKSKEHKRTLSQISNTQKEEVINNVNTQNYVNKFSTNEEKIVHCLKDSLKLFEKIQENFEKSAHDNKNREMEIKNILKTIKVVEYPCISDFEKRLIGNQIAESSQQRIQNYENLFNIINTSIRDLSKFFIENFNKSIILYKLGENDTKQVKDYPPSRKPCYSDSPIKTRKDQDLPILQLPNDLDSSNILECTNDDICNFSESHMLERSMTNKLKEAAQLSRKKTKKTKFNIADIDNEGKLDEIAEGEGDNNDETVIDYVYNVLGDMKGDRPSRRSTIAMYEFESDRVHYSTTDNRKLTLDKSEKCFIY